MSVLPQLRPTTVGDNVYQLSSLGAKVTAIESGGDLLLVDTGARGSFPFLARSLARLGLQPDRVRSVVLTHTHPDHVGALSRVVEETGASVVVHDEEANALETQHPAETLPTRLSSNRMSRALAQMMCDGTYSGCDRVIDGEVLDWPDELQIVHTPGHTPGSVSLYMPTLRLVVVGDALQHRFHRLSGPARWATTDYPRAIDSLYRLAQLDIETMVFSHFPPLQTGAKQELLRLLDRLESRQA